MKRIFTPLILFSIPVPVLAEVADKEPSIWMNLIVSVSSIAIGLAHSYFSKKEKTFLNPILDGRKPTI